MKPRYIAALLVSALAILCIAGTKLSRLTRTRSLQTNSLFLVSTQASDGRFSSRNITAEDLGSSLSQWISGSGGGAITMGAELFVDAATGNDNTGTRGRPDKPFATPFAAKSASQSNDTIIVRAGTYTTVTNLWFNGTWFFEGALLRLIDIPTNTTGAGLFDDRFSGAVNCTVGGALSIEYHTGTNVLVSPVDCTFSYNTNALGPIVVTNRNSYIRWDANTRLGLCGQQPVPFAITVLQCVSNSYFRDFEIYNLNPTNVAIITTNCPADPGTVYSITTGCAGIHWGEGDVIIHANIRPMTLQAVWGDNLTTNGGQMWISGEISDGKWYLVGRTNTWKIWANFDEYLCSQDTIDHILFDCWNSGSHYFRGQKASSLGRPIVLQNPDAGQRDTNLQVWVDIDKLSGSNTWAEVKHGELRGMINHFQQNGPNNGGSLIIVTNVSAFMALNGLTMEGANTLLTHSGGTTELHGYAMRSTNQDPIFVFNSGLSLDVSSIATVNGTNSVRSSTAQNVTINRSFSGPSNHANITLVGTNRTAGIDAVSLKAIALSVINAGLSNAVTTNALTINAGISNAITTNALTINAGISNLIATNVLAVNSWLSNAIVTNTTIINAGISNAVVTNALVINAGISNAVVTNTLIINAGISNAVVTNTLIVNAGVSNVTGTNFLIINAGISNLVGTNISARLGSGTSNAMWTGGIFQDFTSYTNHSSASLNVTNLGTLILPAHSLTNAGDQLRYYHSGRFQNALAMTNELWLRYGSITNVLDTGLITASNTAYEAWLTITAITATKQRAEATLRFLPAPGLPWVETNVVTFLAESNGVANTVGLYHAGQHQFTVTNESIIADWRKGYK